MTSYFNVDARTILALGRQSIRDAGTAVLELVKNAYDADAKVVRVTISKNSICILDDGQGMTTDKVRKSWLRIGASEKIAEPYTVKGRRRIGEKGVGRLSADRLGASLHMQSQSQDARSCEVIVDWSLFEVNGDLSNVPIMIKDKGIKPFEIPVYQPPRHRGKPFQTALSSKDRTGTSLLVTALREQWSPDDVEALETQLSTLIAPFSREIFQIQIVNLSGEESIVESPLERSGEAVFNCSISAPRIVGRDEAVARPSVLVKYTEAYGEQVAGITQKNEQESELSSMFRGEISIKDIRNTGPLEVRLTYVPKTKQIAITAGFTVHQLGAYLNRSAGLRVFRDNVRVYPYGDPAHPEGDWLGMAQRKAASPDAKSRAAFKVPPNRLLGALFITRDDNARLIDVSGREGLVHNEAYRSLHKIAQACIKRLENLIIRNQVPDEEETHQITPREAARSLSRNLGSLSKSLASARNTLRALPTPDRKRVQQLELDLTTTQEEIASFTRQVDQLVNENSLWRILATIGIASTTFSHETLGHIQSAYDNTMLAFELAEDAEDADINEISASLAQSIAHIESVQAWGKFSLDRVRKDKRQRVNVDIDTLVDSVTRQLSAIADVTNIEIRSSLKSGGTIKAFPMDLESIVLNLLTNAYYFCPKGGREDWVIRLSTRSVKREGKIGVRLRVTDSGPGVPEDERSIIWTPLYSTKSDYEGTGLGLAIVAAICEDYGGTYIVTNDPKLGGAQFEIWLPTAR